jgi:site-specific DNA recombinase
MTGNTGKNAKAVGYVRVSTEEQATEGVSLDAQRDKIKAYCDLHGLDLAGIHADEGISGKAVGNRPGLQAALKAVCKAKGVLVVYSLSRLVRSTGDAIDISEMLDKCGADMASIQEKLDTTSSMGRFFFRLMASLGELERDQVSERTVTAMAYKRKQGQRISRYIPFGFDLEPDGQTLRRNEAEQALIGRLLALRGKGESYHALADSLNKRGVRTKRGGRWHAKVIRDILNRAA